MTTDTPPDAGTPQDGKHAPLAVRPTQAARMLGICERKLWELTNRGEIPHAKLGRATLYRVADLDRWLADLTGQTGNGRTR